MRVCSKCGEHKAVDEFYRQAGCKDGLRPECKSCYRSRVKANRENNLEATRETKRRYYQANADAIKKKSTTWQELNRDKSRAKQRAYYSRNKHDYLERKSRYRARTREATPAWSNAEIVQSFYQAVVILNSHGGPVKYSVDHIVPLRNKLVCGLHAHTNMTIIPLPQNKAKNNRHWPNMP